MTVSPTFPSRRRVWASKSLGSGSAGNQIRRMALRNNMRIGLCWFWGYYNKYVAGQRRDRIHGIDDGRGADDGDGFLSHGLVPSRQVYGACALAVAARKNSSLLRNISVRALESSR